MIGVRARAACDPAEQSEDGRERRVTKRFEEIGIQILRRTGTGPNDHNSAASVLADRNKRDSVAQLLGQAFFAAYHLMDSRRPSSHEYVGRQPVRR